MFYPTYPYNARYSKPRNFRTRPAALVTATYNSDQAFGAAVAAQDMNGEYLKVDKFDDKNQLTHTANKMLMFDFLNGKRTVSAEQVARGVVVRDHYRGLMMEMIAGQLKEFLKTACVAASKDEFTNLSVYDLAVIASLPSCYVRDMARRVVQEKKEEIAVGSKHVGRLRERLEDTFTVLDVKFSMKYGVNIYNAVCGTNLFFFFCHTSLEAGKAYRLKGTIKAHRDNNVTQLNRVSVVKV